MSVILAMIALAGHIALLLWGTRMVQTGIQRAFGPGLRSFLGHALSNRMKAFLAGMGVTAVLQSSTATGLMAAWSSGDGRMVANFHTVFKLAVAALFMPFLTPFANALVRFMPQRIDESDPGQPRYLDPSAKETPIVALQAAAREVLRIVDILDEMLAGTKAALSSNDRRALSALRKQDTVLDRLNTAVKIYLTSIDPDELSDTDKRRLEEILIFSTGLEHAGDVLDQNVLPHLAKRLRRGMTFSKASRSELNALFDRLATNLQTAAALFMSQDERMARMLADEKVVFRKVERDGTTAHFELLRKGNFDASETSSLHLDLLRDLKQLNSHLVAATAYPVLEQPGELLQSRIR